MKVTLDIPDQNIVNALDAGQIGDWGDYAESARVDDHLKLVQGTGEPIMVNEFESHKDDSENVQHAMTTEGIQKALVTIGEKWPWHLESILKDNSDAETGDVLIQVAIFGDIIYG